MVKATSSAPSQRMLKVGEMVRAALTKILQRDDIRDPDVDGVVIQQGCIDDPPLVDDVSLLDVEAPCSRQFISFQQQIGKHQMTGRAADIDTDR